MSLYFGPKAPDGLESNWIPTMGKESYLWLRLYAPEDSRRGLWNKPFKMPDEIERCDLAAPTVVSRQDGSLLFENDKLRNVVTAHAIDGASGACPKGVGVAARLFRYN